MTNRTDPSSELHHGQVYVDESKSGAYLLVAVAISPTRLATARKTVRSLVLPGQRRLHMKTESDVRRRQILSTFDHAGFTVRIYRADTNFKNDIMRRRACLDALVADIARCGHTRLCLESDESMDARDRRALALLTRTHGCQDLVYFHERAAAEPLVAIPDAIGWAWARGGGWRQRAIPLVEAVIDL
ncbi:hypothetical protein [Antribacter gilvus]|uniref:hypothetical protein n=1 Tax=Antribacter gilvus TaxID=2304675 RepID=UPI000F785964|nr:hypothetical protein [Antribacter gilvus]